MAETIQPRIIPTLLPAWILAGLLLIPSAAEAQTFTRASSPVVASESLQSLGVAWGDYDNDGLLDLFVANSGSKNSLFHNEGEGIFSRVTTGAIASDTGDSRGSLWIDYDNDGDLDAFLGHAGGPKGIENFLYRNEGGGAFEKVTTGPVATDRTGTLGSGWGEYDNDGDLDLFTANGGLDKLYRNNGDGTFTSTTQSMVGRIVSTQPKLMGRGAGRLRQRRLPGRDGRQRWDPERPLPKQRG